MSFVCLMSTHTSNLSCTLFPPRNLPWATCLVYVTIVTVIWSSYLVNGLLSSTILCLGLRDYMSWISSLIFYSSSPCLTSCTLSNDDWLPNGTQLRFIQQQIFFELYYRADILPGTELNRNSLCLGTYK